MSSLLPIVHVAPRVHNPSEGLAASVCRICSELAGLGHDVTLITLYEPAVALDERVRVEVYPPRRVGLRLGLAPRMWQRLLRLASRRVILHDHGLWLMPNIYAGWLAKNPNVRLIVSPHGMVSEWALNHHRWRKRVAWWLLSQRHLFARAAAFHVTAGSEADEIRQLGYPQPIHVIPIGVEIPERPDSSPVNKERRRLVFLSRIHPKKGVDLLLRAWQALHPEFPDWDLIVAGPDNGGHLGEMRRLATGLRLQRVSFPGPVYGHAKSDLLFSADLFALPTRSENFGMVVAEVLAHSVPVVTTKKAPWKDLVARRCGWWVDIGVPELTAALSEAMALSIDERRSMGARGREWMDTSFAWVHQAQALSRCYHSVGGAGC